LKQLRPITGVPIPRGPSLGSIFYADDRGVLKS